MSILRRISMIFRAEANHAMDRAEDPRRMMDYSYERQLVMLQEVRRGIADVAASRKRLELQVQEIAGSMDTLEQQAAHAVSAGRDDLAREALTRRAMLHAELNAVTTQHHALVAQEEKLANGLMRLNLKVDAFRTRKETIKANYSAAEAQFRINEALSDLSSEMRQVGDAVRRAEDKTAEMQAHANAMEELMAAGAFDIGSGDPVQRELDRLTAEADVERELARLKKLPLEGRRPQQN